jgi:hypothetical protein
MRKILMHDRIKQLWDTAAKLESDPSWEGQTRFMEKFAELIVEECCNRLSEETIIHDGYGYNQHELYNRLRKHFGVAE